MLSVSGVDGSDCHPERLDGARDPAGLNRRLGCQGPRSKRALGISLQRNHTGVECENPT